MTRTHSYETKLTWIGNRGTGTSGYKDYSRDHTIAVGNKPLIKGSSDPSFRGDPSRYNPEELLVSSLSSCHMLWFLHLASVNNIVVLEYEDQASGLMEETEDGGGQFLSVTLSPIVTVAEKSMIDNCHDLHIEANKLCFIAKSVNFPVHHKAVSKVKD